MLPDLPLWIPILFILTFILALSIFYISNNKPNRLMVIIILWSLAQAAIAFTGFYAVTDTFPPRFIILLLPVFLLVIYGLTGHRKAKILEGRDIRLTTFLHTIRIPIEIVLLYLFIHKAIPELMTFEGRNFDILAGITAPVVGWLYYKDKLSDQALLIWNYIALAMVVFIAVNALLSAELPFQQFAFDQPNRAVTYFPFILLPGVIVPMVIYQHLADIIVLRSKLKT